VSTILALTALQVFRADRRPLLLVANCAHLVIVVLAFHRPRKPIVASAAVGLMQTF
jgi:hypothetical protein